MLANCSSPLPSLDNLLSQTRNRLVSQSQNLKNSSAELCRIVGFKGLDPCKLISLVMSNLAGSYVQNRLLLHVSKRNKVIGSHLNVKPRCSLQFKWVEKSTKWHRGYFATFLARDNDSLMSCFPQSLHLTGPSLGGNQIHTQIMKYWPYSRPCQPFGLLQMGYFQFWMLLSGWSSCSKCRMASFGLFSDA